MRIPVAYILYGVAGTTLALMIVRFMTALMSKINITMFTTITIKLLKAGNLDRAVKLCRAAPRSAFVSIILPVFEYAQRQEDIGGMRAIFDEGYATLVKRTGKDLIFGGIGIFVGALAAIFGLRLGQVHPAYFGICGFSALLGFGLIRGALKLRAQAPVEFEKIIATFNQSTTRP